MTSGFLLMIFKVVASRQRWSHVCKQFYITWLGEMFWTCLWSLCLSANLKLDYILSHATLIANLKLLKADKDGQFLHYHKYTRLLFTLIPNYLLLLFWIMNYSHVRLLPSLVFDYGLIFWIRLFTTFILK